MENKNTTFPVPLGTTTWKPPGKASSMMDLIRRQFSERLPMKNHSTEEIDTLLNNMLLIYKGPVTRDRL